MPDINGQAPTGLAAGRSTEPAKLPDDETKLEPWNKVVVGVWFAAGTRRLHRHSDAVYTDVAMPPTEPSLRARPSLRSFTWLYLVLGVICVLIWWAGVTLDSRVSPFLIALAGPIPLALGLAYSWLVRLSSEYRLFQDSLEVETGLVARTVDNLQLFRVRDLRLRQSMLGRLLGGA